MSLPTKEFFISYAHEDLQIANALADTLRQIDDTFVIVNIDKISLESGLNFRTQLEDKLQRSEVLFVVHTDAAKQAFGYTGWEVGYFEGVHKADDSPIISLHLTAPPATTSDRQGISLDITTDDLRLDTEAFKARLATEITSTHPLVRFMNEKRLALAVERQNARLGASRDIDTEQCVRAMVLSVFQNRKNKPDCTIKPQKQITIKTQRESLQAADGDLPPTAELVPVGEGAPMSVFGLPERSITWAAFRDVTEGHALGRTWVEALKAVIASASPNQINVDNSQIILSPDSHVYRLILTTSTTYFNGNMEVNVYLVEALRRPDYGDVVTTRLLKGLELASRFRSLFLEKDSRFYWQNVKMLRAEEIRTAARAMVIELNLLQRDSMDAGLHEPSVWGKLVDWALLDSISNEWRPRDERIRATCAKLWSAKTREELEPLRGELVTVIRDLENGIRPYNGKLIVQMADHLLKIVQETDDESGAESVGVTS